MRPLPEAPSGLITEKLAAGSTVGVGGIDVGVIMQQAETMSVVSEEDDEGVPTANDAAKPASKVACYKADKNCSLRSFWTKKTRKGKIIISGVLVLLLLLLIVIVAVFSSGDKSGTGGQQTTLDEEGSISTPSMNPLAPPTSPSPKPMFTPAPSFDPEGPTIKALIEEGITYEPGNLLVKENGLILSKGLTSRIIATSQQKVPYHDGSESKLEFHERPDFGATFQVPDDHTENQGGWVYTSNSEMEETGAGGVGAITFDKDGNVIKYEMVLTGTTMNCGGGRTPWGSWVSCEELDNEGEIYQVDPFGLRKARITSVGRGKGRFESFTYDDRNKAEPHFFASEDRKRGALRRFTPAIVDWEHDPWNMLHGDGKLEFLVLEPKHENATEGIFRWTEDQDEAKQNAFDFYPESEGVDRDGNELFLVTKLNKWLFVLDLDAMKYARFSTEHGKYLSRDERYWYSATFVLTVRSFFRSFRRTTRSSC
jgi:hypothetical protein